MKKQTNISLNPDIKDRAAQVLKEQGSNLSTYIESQLNLLIGTTIKSLDVNKLFFKCDKCGRMSKEGYLCDLTKKVYCLECHLDYKWKLCDYKTHNHFRIPFIADRDINSEEINDLKGISDEI